MQVFIADIRNCQNKEQEKARVDKELGKIRKKFASNNTITGGRLAHLNTCQSAILTPVTAQDVLMTSLLPSEYDRKKYVWKLLYIYMLGYEVEFGHKQAADLIPAQR